MAQAARATHLKENKNRPDRSGRFRYGGVKEAGPSATDYG
jgi:hypothetical protein